MKNILCFINSFGIGGVETQLLRTLPLLRQSGWNYFVVALRPPRTLQKEFEQHLFQTQLLLKQRLPPAIQIIIGILKLARFVANIHPSIIHTALFPANIIARITGWLTKVPVVEHLVNILYDPLWLLEPQLSSLKLTIQHKLDKMTVKIVDHFIALSKPVKLSAQQKLGVTGRKISIIPYGVFPEDWQRSQNKCYDDSLIVTVGRLIMQKGHKYLIMAMPRIIEKFPYAKAIIIGNGPLRSELEELLNIKMLNEKVFLLGSLPPNEIKNYFWQASLFVFPSLSEGQGVALLEAMAAGLPVVTSDIPAVREIIGGENVGITVKPMDPEALADAICELLSSPERRELMGKRAQEIVRERFDLRKLAPRWLEVYEKVLCHDE